MVVVISELPQVVIDRDHYQPDIRSMPGFKRITTAGTEAGSVALRSFVSITLLCGPILCTAQTGTAPSAPDMRASVDRPAPLTPTPSVITLEMRGDIYMARKMYREAIDLYRQSPASPIADNKIGIAFQQMSKPLLAKKYYESAIKQDRNFADAINNLGTVYYSDRAYGKAISYFKRSLKCSGPIASTYANLGSAYFGRHDYKRASGYFEQALKLDPNVLEHANGFGTRVQDTVPDMALFHLYLARTYAKAGSDERALNYLRKAMEEGLKNRHNLADLPEFNTLRTKPEFRELLAENPKPL